MVDQVPRQLPHDLDIEMAALGCALLDKEACTTLCDRASEEWFYASITKMLFSTILELTHTDVAIDVNTVTALLRQHGQLDAIGGGSYLTSLIDRVTTPDHITEYLRLIEGKYKLRSLVILLESSLKNLYEGAKDCDDHAFFENLVAEINKLSETIQVSSGTYEELRVQIERTNASLEKHCMEGLQFDTGLKVIDRANIIQPGSFTVLAGRAGHGKSALGIYIALQMARQSIPSLIISAEMPHEDCIKRLYSVVTSTNTLAFQYPKKYLTQNSKECLEDVWKKVSQASNKLWELPLRITDARPTPGTIRRAIKDIKRQFRVQTPGHASSGMVYVFVDALQGIRLPGFKGEETPRLNEIVARLREIVNAEKCALILCAHLKKRDTTQVIKEPTMDDLKGTSEIEHEADAVMLQFWPWYANPGTSKGEHVLQLRFGKNRRGPVWDWADVYWDPVTQNFLNIALEPLHQCATQDLL